MVAEAKLFLAGPTAAGKTSASVSLAKALNAEIISVDSALVYRRLDIGTAKPHGDERGGIAHHLIDIREPWESYSAAAFRDDALARVGDIEARGKRVLFVGGTMLYWHALSVGLAELPDADPQLRAEIVARAERDGWARMHEELQRIDPQAAARIHVNDAQRLQRALEVWHLTGRTLTDLQRHTVPAMAGPTRILALIPQDRAWLHRRIAARVQSLQTEGFVEEVAALLQDARVAPDLPAMKSVGYRQVVDYLSGRRQSWLPEATAATRQLAKRQLTWLRNVANVEAIPCDTLSASALENRLLVEARRLLSI